MPLWIFRLSAIAGLPALAYVYTKDLHSVLLALICGIVLVAAEYFVRSLKFVSMMIGIFGALTGFALSLACDYVVLKMNISEVTDFWVSNKTVLSGILAVLGGFLAISKSTELEGLSRKGRHIKIADMSALIDGRIVDLCESGFLSGTIVLPKFVLDKLSALSNSKDPLEKAKGRRGLDIVTRLKELKGVPVKITSKDAVGKSTAQRVVALAHIFKGEVVTVDFNVNKEAVLVEVPVLNICDLTNALKPVVLPGENMSLFIMKEGKEKEQGIGYLDDGTMVVVEDGRKQIGHRAEVSVYSILQTSSGRMIFARLKI